MMIKVCTGPTCTERGGGCLLMDAIRAAAAGRTDVSVEETACQQIRCARGPNVRVDSRWHEGIKRDAASIATLIALPVES